MLFQQGFNQQQNKVGRLNTKNEIVWFNLIDLDVKYVSNLEKKKHINQPYSPLSYFHGYHIQSRAGEFAITIPHLNFSHILYHV